MRENRTCGSEGGEAQSLPYPYPDTILGYCLPIAEKLTHKIHEQNIHQL